MCGRQYFYYLPQIFKKNISVIKPNYAKAGRVRHALGRFISKCIK